jgi:hypothetical protein
MISFAFGTSTIPYSLYTLSTFLAVRDLEFSRPLCTPCRNSVRDNTSYSELCSTQTLKVLDSSASFHEPSDALLKLDALSLELVRQIYFAFGALLTID